MALIIRRADLYDRTVDVRLERGLISSVDERISPQAGDEVIEARGGALIPGLHDHHIHLRAWVASRASVFVGPAALSGETGLAAALRQAVVGDDGWTRAVGYHESVAGDLDRHVLDRLVPNRPVRVQHRSGVLWVMNSLGLQLLGAAEDPSPGIERSGDDQPTGRLWRMDGWLAERLANVGDQGPAEARRTRLRSALSVLSQEAASIGVTGWTDATPGRDDAEASEVCDAAARGSIRQRLHLMMPLDTQCLDGGARTPGPVKILLDDDRLPSLDWFSALVSDSHHRKRAVAVHCVTATQLALTFAAFESAFGEQGAVTEPDREGDRIEHGAIIPAAFLPLLAGSRLTIVTQPNFVFERGDEYLTDVDADEQADIWRLRSLVDSGVPVAAGTDAPFGSSDPWLAVRASMRRLTRSGRFLGQDERVDWATALRLWQGEATRPGSSRRVAPGHPADLVLLGEPLPTALEGVDPVDVRATLIGGELAFAAD